MARLAHRFLPFKPDTDVAMLNAMMNVIVTEGLVDEGFIAQRTIGYDELRAAPPTAAKRRCPSTSSWAVIDHPRRCAPPLKGQRLRPGKAGSAALLDRSPSFAMRFLYPGV